MINISSKNHLVHLILVFSLINLIQTQTNVTLEYTDWVEITEGWPLQDEYSRNNYKESTTFYYIKNIDSRIKWLFNQTNNLVDDQIYKLSFKYWSWKSKTGSAARTDIRIGDNYPTDELYYRYHSYPVGFSNNWMPVEYVLSGKQLKSIDIRFQTGDEDSLIAFKDFKVEYESTVANNNELEISLVTTELVNGTFEIAEHSSSAGSNVTEQNCFVVEYTNQDDIQLNVVFIPKNEKNNKQNIFTLKPKVTETIETINLCLEDLISFSAQNFKIAFNVKHRKNSNNFVFAVNQTEPTPPPTPKVIKTQNFLRPMTESFKSEWQNEWKEISTSNIGSNFKLNNDHVQFYANTKSETRATAHLISDVWIKYDSALHSVDSQYSVKVEDSLAFNSFRIRPKVCDWLSHCYDVIQTHEEDVKTGSELIVERTISFKFNPIDNTEFIKIQFYVEYFKPSYLSDEELLTIKFDFQLKNFGDPCFMESQCHPDHSATCVSDPAQDKPNELICNCADGWTGELCQKIDYCRTIDDKLGFSGGKYCKMKQGGTKCESTANSFRCLCGFEPPSTSSTDGLIIWDTKNQECAPLMPKLIKGWITTGADTPDYVTNAVNSLVYNFGGVNTQLFDVCLDISYTSDESVQLSADYRVGTDSSSLFNLHLATTDATAQVIKFCVTDFIHDIADNFDLEFKISKKDNKFKDKTFVLKDILPSVKPLSPSVHQYIESWKFVENVLNSDPNSRRSQKWPSIPDAISQQTYTDKEEMFYKMTIPNGLKDEIDYLFLSDWIRYDTSFDGKTLDFTIRYTKGDPGHLPYFRVYVSIIYQESGQNKITVPAINWNDSGETPEGDGDHDKITGQIKFKANSLKNVFKIVFRIEKTGVVPTTSIDIELRGISLGDACHRGDGKNPCDKLKCKREMANIVKCQCDPAISLDKIGNMCDQTDHCKTNTTNKILFSEVCLSFPNGKCDQLSPRCICDEKNYVWDDKSQSCVQKIFYYSHRKTCEGNACDLFDKIKADTKWWDKTMPKVMENSPYLPFHYTTKTGSQIAIKIKNLKPTVNPCLNLTYQLSSANSALQVSYGDNSPIELSTFMANDNQWIEERICVNSLTKDMGTDFNVVLKSKLRRDGTDSLSIKLDERYLIEEELKKDKIKNTFDFLRQWERPEIKDDKQYERKNQWPLIYPSNEWKDNPEKSLEFEPQYTGKQTSTLMSNWIKKWDDITGYKLRFNISGTQFTDYLIKFEIFDEMMKSKLLNTDVKGSNIGSKDKNVVVPISPPSSYFRVAIKVIYNYIQVLPQTIFSINSVDLGDPCVEGSSLYNTCNNHGTCEPRKPVKEYFCDCGDSGYINETDCLKMDYCNSVLEEEKGKTNRNGNKFCEDRGDLQGLKWKCQNGGLDGFICDCGGDDSKYWVNRNTKSCIPKPECEKDTHYDPMKQTCSFNEATNQTEIKCKEGFVEISDKKCEEYEVCNENHRKIVKQTPEKPCSDQKSVCYPKYKTTDPDDQDDYICACQEGYKNTGTEREPKCSPLFCELQSMNKCDQKCVVGDASTKEGYTCECFNKDFYTIQTNGKCQSTTKKCNCPAPSFCINDENDCHCKGVNGKTTEAEKDKDGKITCPLNSDTDVSKDVCPGGKTIVEKDRLVCDCGQHYINNKTDDPFCYFKSICGEGSDGRKDCDRRNKLCYIDSTDKGYHCSGVDSNNLDGCLPGMINSNGVCIDACKAPKLEDCSRFNAECDPTREFLESEKVQDYCKCRPGFIESISGSSFHCIVGKYSVQFSLNIKNSILNTDPIKEVVEAIDDSHFAADLKGFYDAMKQAHLINLNRTKMFTERHQVLTRNNEILGRVRDLIKNTDYFKFESTLRIQSCEEKNFFFNCQFTLTLDKTASEYAVPLNKQLSELCIKYKDSDYCFFPFPPKKTFYAVTDEPTKAVVANQKELDANNPQTYKTCKESAKQHYTNCEMNSNCVDSVEKDTSLYSCVCDPEFYDVTAQDFVPSDKGDFTNQTIREHCAIKKNLCTERCYKDGTCKNFNISIFRENSNHYYVPVLCGCPEKTKLNDQKKPTACVAVCHGVSCGDGECFAKGQNEWACLCNDKYTGEYCDNKLSEGGWIAAVAVLAVVVAIVAGVAIFFARRKRTTNISQSTRQLDDFSDNTSYRVRQSGGVV